MKKVYIKGYFGYKNFGDDLFLLTSSYIFSEVLEGITPVYIGTDLPILSDKSIVKKAKSNFIKKMIEFYIIFRVDYIIYFGGSLFSCGGLNPGNIKYIFRKINRFKGRLFTFGVSIGPFSSKKCYKTTEQLLSKFRYIGVRDEKSVELIDKMNITVEKNLTFDNAILLRQIYPSFIKKNVINNKYNIGISICKYETYQNGDIEIEKIRLNSIKETLQELIKVENNIKLNFYVFNGSDDIGDFDITKTFYSYFSEIVDCELINYSKDSYTFLESFLINDFIIGTRLHSAILAYTFEIPFFMVEYHSKCREFISTVKYDGLYQINDTLQNANIISNVLNKKHSFNYIDPEYFLDIQLCQIEKLKNTLV